MKNREKYDEEIRVAIRNNSMSEFYDKHIAPYYGINIFDNTRWVDAGFIVAAWMGDEYVEPEIDWSTVPVDTLIEVRNCEKDPWTPRYFKEYKGSMVCVWGDGATSKTATFDGTWRYARLPEVD